MPGFEDQFRAMLRPVPSGEKESANDENFTGDQISPTPFRTSQTPRLSLTGEALSQPETAATRLRDQYLRVAEIYDGLSELAGRHGASKTLTPQESRAIVDFARKFIEVGPLINMTLEQARTEFEIMVVSSDIGKIQAASARYAEYAVDVETQLHKEQKRMLQTAPGDETTTRLMESDFLAGDERAERQA